jgi:hypothetical protein
MKNYRFLGDEAEILGARLDAARNAYEGAKNLSWAKKYWKQVIDRLLFQWKQLPVLHDGDARTTIIPRWTIDYEFFETQQEGNLYGVTDRFYDMVFRKDADLNASWERNREKRLARCQ